MFMQGEINWNISFNNANFNQLNSLHYCMVQKKAKTL